MKIARVILNLACPRDCSYCCNKYAFVKRDMIEIDSIDEVADSDVICLSGGEPAIIPDTVVQTAERIRFINPNAKIYLYSAKYTSKNSFDRFIKVVDGIHFTLHVGANEKDITDFHIFQDTIVRQHYKDKSFRLYINPEVDQGVEIKPWCWSRVEIKPWIPEGEMTLPPNEKLYILKGT